MTGGGGPSGEVYFEFTQLGGQMRVAAIDVATAIEVIVIAPLTATKLQMQSLALAKLRKKLSGQEPQPLSPSGRPRGKYA